MDVIQIKISIHAQMRDRVQRNTVLVVLELFLVNNDLEAVIVSADTDVEAVALLDRVRLALFFAPFAVVERVQDDLEIDRCFYLCEWLSLSLCLFLSPSLSLSLFV